MTCAILEPQTRIKRLHCALEEWSFKQWTARKVQKYSIYLFFFSLSASHLLHTPVKSPAWIDIPGTSLF